MTCASERSAFDPTCRKTERLEFRFERVCDCPNACKVHRSAVDVDDVLEQAQRARFCAIDVAYDAALRRRCRRKSRRARKAQQPNCKTTVAKTHGGFHLLLT